MRELSLKLKNIKLLDYANNLILVVLSITFFLLTISSYIYGIVLIVYLIYLFKKTKKIFKLSIVLILLVLVIYLLYRYDDNFRETNIYAKVIDAKYYGEYAKYIVKAKGHKVLVYDYDYLNIKVGMYVNIKGSFKNTTTLFTPNAFDYTKYLKNNRIFYALVIEDVSIVKQTYTISYIRYLLMNYFDNHYTSISASFLKALLVGYSSSLDSEFYESLKDNGTMHLFAISGLHVSFFTMGINKLLDKIKVKEVIKEIIIIIFLILYSIITNFSPSILRTSIMYVILSLSKRYKYYLSSLDICSIAFLILIIINPLYAFNNGFILSFLVSFSIIMTSPLLDGLAQVKQIFYLSVVSLLLTLPVVVNINYEINLLSPIINVVFISLVTFLMLPLTIMVAFIYPLDYIYSNLVTGFSKISVWISKYFNIGFRIGKMMPIAIIIYYLLLGIIFYTKSRKIRFRSIMLLVIYLLILNNINLLKPYDEVYFLDMYYGESTVIFSKFKNSVVVIDTGDGTNDTLTNFLKSKGVKNVECCIITHNHLDHMGELQKLCSDFKVNSIIISGYDDYSYNLKTSKVRAGSVIKLARFSFEVINPSFHHEDINDDSLVLYGCVGGFNMLFCGDITIKSEQEIVDIVKNLDIDILKVAHHGSNTSSSINFLKAANPKYAIIMNGRIKRFGFPSYQVVSSLKELGIKTYITKESKTIWFRRITKQYRFYSLA